jgi:glycerol-3-phosphate acyltransferase PlsX
MRIVLDAMGSDDHPHPEVRAALDAFQRWGDPVILTGPQDRLEQLVAEAGGTPEQVDIVHAPEVLKMTDKPARAAKGKAQNSMAVGMELLKEEKADAFVTAGNTGGAMANGLFRLGRIRGVKRPGLAIGIPVRDGHAIILDIGANTECRPEFLVQFAILGSTYAQVVFDVSHPRVGLLSNGEEPEKGNLLGKETFPLLASSGLNFIGNVEPKEVFSGVVDVVVTDGYTGNIFIKTSETIPKFLFEIIRTEIQSTPVTSVGALLAKPAFRRVRELLDPSEYGAAPLLGINGLVFIGHGRSNAKALVSAIGVARQAVRGNVMSAIHTALEEKFSSE